MNSNTNVLRKVPPFMNKLEDAYNICYGGLNTIEKCQFGKPVSRKINGEKLDTYQLYIIHYQLCNKEQLYKISYVQENMNICNSFFDKEHKMYMSDDGEIGCLFNNNDNKLTINLFKNEGNKGSFFFTSINSVSVKDMHKRFFMHESFCSFNSNNTLLLYTAESEDVKLKKENSIFPKSDLDALKKLNTGVYTETFGDQWNYSFFYLYLYNLIDNTVKYITVKDPTSCFYNPKFIDETSFVCLSYRTVPYRLSMHGLNTKPNDLLLCTLNDPNLDIPIDGDSTDIKDSAAIGNSGKSKKNHVRCAYIKLSCKNFRHVASPTIIKDKDQIYVACLVVFNKNDGSNPYVSDYSLVLIKLEKDETKKNKKTNKDVHMEEEKSLIHYENTDDIYYEHNNISGLKVEDYRTDNIHVNNNNTNDKINDDACNYKKTETYVLVKEGEYTPYFRGIYTDEIIGYCYPYIFLNTILYCNKIIIAVHMFSKKVYRVLINDIYNENDSGTSIEILCMKENNLLISIRNMLLNDILMYCIFDERHIKGDFIYLTNLKSYNIDFSTYRNIEKTRDFIYSNINDNSKNLFKILSELETSLFENKHPYIRRKKSSYNLLYQSEQEYLNDIKDKGVSLSNFNLFNKNNLRNLILYIHGGPYCMSFNEYKNLYIFFAACGFDVLCVNYIGSLTFTDKPILLNGIINTIEIDDILAVLQSFSKHFGDYENIYLYGHSYGGFASCSLLTKSNIFKGGCVINGVYEWILSAFSTDIPDFIISLTANKNPEYDCVFDKHDYTMLYEMSPLNYAQNIQAPVLIICSTNDMRVNYHNSIALYNRLRALKKKTKLFLFDGEHHVINNYHYQETMLMNIILWFYDYDNKKKK
ncbi:peptidase, putative [Plasmodium vinckei brucechwatti]|uniref:Peptidase, putative n=1 Tax=Plasmodium vinckei brucechwatti TaxID=119398 RepID=A0A6V7SH57_PLAVN|nr:peptidase, putative [Plasmodium vinckei brucechwatti]